MGRVSKNRGYFPENAASGWHRHPRRPVGGGSSAEPLLRGQETFDGLKIGPELDKLEKGPKTNQAAAEGGETRGSEEGSCTPTRGTGHGAQQGPSSAGGRWGSRGWEGFSSLNDARHQKSEQGLVSRWTDCSGPQRPPGRRGSSLSCVSVPGSCIQSAPPGRRLPQRGFQRGGLHWTTQWVTPDHGVGHTGHGGSHRTRVGRTGP